MMKRHLALGSALAAISVACFGGWQDARALLIDDFTTSQTLSVTSPATEGGNQALDVSILGGERDLSLTRLSGTGLSNDVSSGSMSYAQDAGAQGTGVVVWDGVDGEIALDPVGLGGVDLTESGVMDAIRMTVLSGNVSATGTFYACTDVANCSLATFTLPGNIPPDPQAPVTIDFTDFVVLVGAGADFTNIGALWMLIDGSSTAGLAAEIGSISTVSAGAPLPEPETAALLALGLLGLGVVRRSRLGGMLSRSE